MKRNYRAIDRTIRRSAGRRSISELRNKTGLPPSVIEARAQRMGVSVNTQSNKRSRDELHQLIREYAGSLSAHEIAEVAGYKPATVRSVASQLGVSLLRQPGQRKAAPQSATDRFLRRSA